jgi:hypothetical protein
MTMQILDVVLYSHDGRHRRLPLKLGRVNVITGASKTGKSALIDVVDYCFGADECRVPEGPIRRRVGWFGLRLQVDDSQMFVARRCPAPRANSSEDCYVDFGTTVDVPPGAVLRQTTNKRGLIGLLTTHAGIKENIHEPPPGQTRGTLSATIRHAVALCFQPQDEIIRRQQLFHNADDNYFAQALKDTLPYFLGAVDDDFVRRREELRKLREQLRSIDRRLAEIASLRGQGVSKADALLAQARDVGLATSTPQNWEETVAALRVVAATPVVDIDAPTQDGVEFARLGEQRRALLDEQRRIREEIAAARSLQKDESSFSIEAREQTARLKSIGIFDGMTPGQNCPLCAHALEPTAQSPSVADIAATLATVSTRLQSVTAGAPQVEKAISELEDRARLLQDALANNRGQMEAVRAANDQVAKARDEATKRAHILGRVSLYLESMPDLPDTKALEEQAADLRKKIGVAENDLSYEQIRERLESILSILGQRMTAWARGLELEHSKFPLRLDLKKLTIIADTSDGPVPMERMGSGENWVGYHLIAHLALHQWFVERKRPVPGFVFFDQPSQVYFPPEKVVDGSVAAVSDDDRQAVSRMFKLVFDAVAEVAPGFQVVITEHADIDDERYQSAIVERWRGGLKLVPDDWPTAQSEAG